MKTTFKNKLGKAVLSLSLISTFSLADTDMNVFDEKEMKSILFVQQNPSNIQYIENPSEKVQLEAVQSSSIKISPEIIEQLELFSIEPEIIKQLEERRYEYSLGSEEKFLLMMIDKMTETIQQANKITETIRLSSNQINLEIIEQLESVQIDPEITDYLGRVIYAADYDIGFLLMIIDKMIKKIEYVNRITETIKLSLKQGNYIVIKYIENPSERVQLAAVENNPESIQYIKNPTEKVQLAAVKKDPNSIKYIENPSEELQILAVENISYAIQYIKNPTEKVQLVAVKKDSVLIKYIENPTERVKLLAVKNNPKSILYIKNPSERVKLVAFSGNPDLEFDYKHKLFFLW